MAVVVAALVAVAFCVMTAVLFVYPDLIRETGLEADHCRRPDHPRPPARRSLLSRAGARGRVLTARHRPVAGGDRVRLGRALQGTGPAADLLNCDAIATVLRRPCATARCTVQLGQPAGGAGKGSRSRGAQYRQASTPSRHVKCRRPTPPLLLLRACRSPDAGYRRGRPGRSGWRSASPSLRRARSARRRRPLDAPHVTLRVGPHSDPGVALSFHRPADRVRLVSAQLQHERAPRSEVPR